MPYSDPIKRQEYSKKYGKQWYQKAKNSHQGTCPVCGNTFHSRYEEQLYCSLKCSGEAKKNKQLCKYCGKEFSAPPSKKRLFCSKACAGMNKAGSMREKTKQMWKDGIFDKVDWKASITDEMKSHMRERRISANKEMVRNRHPKWKGGKFIKDGHIYNWLEKDYDHRVIARSILKRDLTSDEIVHHIDHNKVNNALDNLMVVDKRDHMSYHKTLNKEVLAKYLPLSFYTSTSGSHHE